MATQPRSADELVKMALLEPGRLDKLRADPALELQKLAREAVAVVPQGPVLESDMWIYRIVVSALGLAILCAVIGGIVLAAMKITPLPEVLIAIGSAAVGALAGLLATPPSRAHH